MAGIGFELRRLYQQESISAVLASVGHGAVIAAGPWLFTIFSLAAITFTVEGVAGFETLASFRIVIIYAFATSLVLTAPVAIVATRLVADALWQKKPEAVRPLLIGANLIALSCVGPCVGVLVWYFNVAPRLALTVIAASLVVAVIWVVLSFCGAVRDYRGVTLSFLGGLAVAVVLSIAAAIAGLGAAAMAWGFLTGLTITFFGLTQRVLATFPLPLVNPLAGVGALLRGLYQYRHLAAGALASTAGVWVDKWLFWFSPAGESVNGSLMHAPLYDSAMFISSLVIIPSLASFVVKLETDFFDRYQHYFCTIQAHGTLRQIEHSRAWLAAYTLDNLVLITVAQIGICAVLVLTAPAIVEALSLQFRQIAILRFGALGTVFLFVFLASSSMLLFFDRRRLYLALQVLFLALNAGLTQLTISLGEDYYGVGFFLACLIASFVAYRMADATFANLNYLTFLGNNPSITPSSRALRRRATRLKVRPRAGRR